MKIRNPFRRRHSATAELVSVIDQFVSKPIRVHHHITRAPDPTPIMIKAEVMVNGKIVSTSSLQPISHRSFPIRMPSGITLHPGDDLVEVMFTVEMPR